MRKNIGRFTGLLAMVAIFVLAISPLYAAEEQKLRVSGTLDIGYYSEYIGPLTGSTTHDKSVFQQSATFVLEPVGLYFSLWNSYSPQGSPNSDFGDEVDFTFGIKKNIGKFAFNLGYTYYDLYNLKDTKTDAHGIFLITNFPKIWDITPSLWLEEDIAVHGGKGGFFYRAGLAHTKKILSQPINFSLSVAGHDEAFGKRAEALSSARFSVSSEIKLWKLAITPAVNFQKRLGRDIHDGGIAQDKIWYGLNVSMPLF